MSQSITGPSYTPGSVVASGPSGSPAAEAGRRDRHAGEGERGVQLRLESFGLAAAAEAMETLVVAVQAPDVAGVPAGPPQRVIDPEVGAVHRSRLLDVALLQQQRSERVACRLHPPPRLVVEQAVIALHGAAEVL